MIRETVQIASRKSRLILKAELVSDAGPATCPVCGKAGSAGGHYVYNTRERRLTFYPCPNCAAKGNSRVDFAH